MIICQSPCAPLQNASVALHISSTGSDFCLKQKAFIVKVRYVFSQQATE